MYNQEELDKFFSERPAQEPAQSPLYSQEEVNDFFAKDNIKKDVAKSKGQMPNLGSQMLNNFAAFSDGAFQGTVNVFTKDVPQLIEDGANAIGVMDDKTYAQSKLDRIKNRQQNVEEAKARYGDSMSAYDVGSTVGGIAPYLLTPGGASTSILGAVGRGALAGGMSGLISAPVNEESMTGLESLQDRLAPTALGAGIGGAVGGVSQGIVKGLQSAGYGANQVDKLPPQLTKNMLPDQQGVGVGTLLSPSAKADAYKKQARDVYRYFQQITKDSAYDSVQVTPAAKGAVEKITNNLKEARRAQWAQDLSPAKQAVGNAKVIPTSSFQQALQQNIDDLKAGLTSESGVNRATIKKLELFQQRLKQQKGMVGVDDITKDLSFFGNMANGKGTLLDRIDPQDPISRKIGASLKDALIKDLDDLSPTSLVNEQVVNSLKQARSNYATNSKQLEDVKNSFLAQLFKGSKDPLPETFIKKFRSGTPTEVKQSIEMLNKVDPDLANSMRKNILKSVIEDARYRQAPQGAPSLDIRKILKEVGDNKKLKALFGGTPDMLTMRKSIQALRYLVNQTGGNSVDLAARIADKSGGIYDVGKILANASTATGLSKILLNPNFNRVANDLARKGTTMPAKKAAMLSALLQELQKDEDQ